MADSLKYVDAGCTQRIHSGNQYGQLYRGSGVIPANSSIPPKYRTIVTDGSDKKGFLSKSKRFNYEAFINDCPGPGMYIKHGSADTYSTSFSKKGTGGMASKTKRQIGFAMSNCSPGPAQYAIKKTSSDFSKANVSRTFQQPIAQQRAKPSLPAPNQYRIVVCDLDKKPAAQSSFKSKTQRDVLNIEHTKYIPSPCHYEVNDELCYDSPKAQLSVFQSKTMRTFYNNIGKTPAPNYYRPHEPVEFPKRQLFPRRHYLSLSAPAMPMPPPLIDPGPGAYDIVNYDGPEKHYMSGSAFVSATSRWTGDASDPAIPGPAQYRPVMPNKQSFIYNHAGRWI